jgi:CheY-like chemotaxis protein
MKNRSDTPRRHVILYAENDDADLLICERAFKPHEHEIELRSVPDGRGVIDWLDGNGPYGNRAFFPLPELLLLDSKLDDMTALEILRWVREQRRLRDMPVVLHTGSTPAHERGAYDELHVAAVIEKDSTCHYLVDCVRSILHGDLVGH